MKAVFLPAMFFVAVSAEQGLALPKIVSQQFNCAYKAKDNGAWSNSGQVDAQMNNDGLSLNFLDNNGSGMDEIRTTGEALEYKVEGRCPGSISLSDSEKKFKIRDFNFVVNFADIGTSEGKIELKATGLANVTNTNQKDSFEKEWAVNKVQLDRWNDAPDDFQKAQLNPFVAKQESQTVCGNQLTLRFDDLRGMVVRKKSSDSEPTEISLNKLHITFDPC
ncbi:MAG TPA: hypothetical protein VE954_31310 [Oligoflexus sp.]|uniref:hypothetical protein n=1 Tax=Oligoflexus sp. TaxID=1971216 RepID=UPI002D30C8F5|nr:hypothetical protein [Oligoflexus sp.]HYX37613.1 hypothetical protein [Oligoflexus sp.]